MYPQIRLSPIIHPSHSYRTLNMLFIFLCRMKKLTKQIWEIRYQRIKLFLCLLTSTSFLLVYVHRLRILLLFINFVYQNSFKIAKLFSYNESTWWKKDLAKTLSIELKIYHKKYFSPLTCFFNNSMIVED